MNVSLPLFVARNFDTNGTLVDLTFVHALLGCIGATVWLQYLPLTGTCS